MAEAAQIGGVLEPINASPVIIEDDVIVGGNCGVYEGTVVRTEFFLHCEGLCISESDPHVGTGFRQRLDARAQVIAALYFFAALGESLNWFAPSKLRSHFFVKEIEEIRNK
jgi:hypothetical protein